MSPNNTVGRPAYKVEELLALRASASESRVSLEKFPDEDVIKAHVIRHPSEGPSAERGENVAPILVNGGAQVQGHLQPQVYEPRNFQTPGNYGPPSAKRPSPTPSVKRTKAEQLIKQHGSPPHVRVTAGGRIVPNDLPQLGSPRLPFAHRVQPGSGQMPHVLPNGIPVGSQLPQGFLAYSGCGKLLQWVDGRWHDIRHDAYGQPMYQLTPPNMPFPSAKSVISGMMPGPMHGPMMGSYPATFSASPSPVMATAGPSAQDIENQLSVSRTEYERVRQEKIELERHEVKASDQLSAAQRQQIVAEKRKYVLKLDNIRKKIKDLETVKANGGASASSNDISSNASNGVSVFPTPMYNMGGVDGAVGAAVSVHNWPMHHTAGPGMFPPATMGNVFFQPAPAAVNGTQANVSPNDQKQQTEHTIESPGSEPSPSSRAQPVRRSHAVQIINPQQGEYPRQHTFVHDAERYDATAYATWKEQTSSQGDGEHPSNLDPTSPSYEPGKPYPLTEGSPPHFVVPAPTPIETPNPPPAELARHWVFSQQQVHAQHAQLQANTQVMHHEKELGNLDNVKTNGNHVVRPEVQHNDNVHGNGNGKGGAIPTNNSSGDDNGERSSQRPTSHSSVTTTDFFPTNTHEHSFNKYMSRKTTAAARLSMEANPCTPMRDPHSGVVSPMTEQLHPRAPPVSPAVQYGGVPPHLLSNSPEDMRLSSFLRDTAQTSAQAVEESIPQHSPVRAETRDEFHGKSRPYLEGYLAGSSGNAPSDPKNQEYCVGYIDGLSKMCLGGSHVTHESSTISLKSETISVTRTPPNTTDNRSLIAELAGTIPSRSENVRLTQSLNFSSPPSGSNHPGSEAPSYNGISPHPPHNSGASQGARSRMTSGSGYKIGNAPLHLPRSWSEDNGGGATGKSAIPISTTGPWNVPSHQPLIVNNEFAIAHPQSALTSLPSHTTYATKRTASTSVGSQPSLTGYSGNLPAARVGLIPQHSVFGDDKYVITATTSTVQTSKAAATTQHENQRSIHSTHSQFDGAMDDLAEMKIAVSEAGKKHQMKTPSIENGYQTTTCTGPATPRAAKPSVAATPQGSPTKSTTSPKKVTSPRYALNRIKGKVGDYLDRSSSYCGGGGSGAANGLMSGEQSRSNSPDPKHMSPEEKKRWKDGWRHKLGVAKSREDGEIRKWRREGGGSGLA